MSESDHRTSDQRGIDRQRDVQAGIKILVALLGLSIVLLAFMWLAKGWAFLSDMWDFLQAAPPS